MTSTAGTRPSGGAVDTAFAGTRTFQVTATDNADNQVTKTVSYHIGYDYSGVFQPINADGSSVFKLGSTIPVKLQLKDAMGNFVSNVVVKIYIFNISGSVTGPEMEAISTNSATTGNLFRYDSTENQYIFNLGTKTLSAGTWKIRIEFDDGTSKYVNVGLR